MCDKRQNRFKENIREICYKNKIALKKYFKKM